MIPSIETSAWRALSVPLHAPAAGALALNATLMIYGKTATRLSEGLFLRVNAKGAADGSAAALALDKLGAWVDPRAVVQGGSHKQHAVGWRGVRSSALQAGGVAASLTVASSSAMLVNVGEPNILPYPVNASAWAPTEGWQWLLSNNGWGTNYPLWSPFLPTGNADQQWAFTLTLGAA